MSDNLKALLFGILLVAAVGGTSGMIKWHAESEQLAFENAKSYEQLEIQTDQINELRGQLAKREAELDKYRREAGRKNSRIARLEAERDAANEKLEMVAERKTN